MLPSCPAPPSRVLRSAGSLAIAGLLTLALPATGLAHDHARPSHGHHADHAVHHGRHRRPHHGRHRRPHHAAHSGDGAHGSGAHPGHGGGTGHGSTSGAGAGTGATGTGKSTSAGAGAGAGLPAGPLTATSGTVLSTTSSSVTLQLASGSIVTLGLPAAIASYLAGDADLFPCETVSVEESSGSELVALQETGASDSAAIADGTGSTCADDFDGSDTVGTLTALSDTAATLQTAGGSLDLSVDPSSDAFDDVSVGDLVDVSYDATQNDLAEDAEDVEDVTSGTVTAASAQALTIRDLATGTSETFQAGDASFDSVRAGDGVVVSYSVSDGQPQADDIADETTGSDG